MAKQNAHQPVIDYRKLFTDLPERYIIFEAIDPIYKIVDVNMAHATITMTKPENIIGRSFFDVFPDVSDKYLKTGVSDMRLSLQRVIRTRKPHTMEKFRYDIKAPDGTFVVRYWLPKHYPIADETGKVRYILQSAQDVTEDVLNEQRLKEIEHQLDEALAIGKVGSWRWNVVENRITGDKNLADMFGFEPAEIAGGITLETFTSAIHPDDRERVTEHIRKTVSKKGLFDDEYRTFGSDGTIHWVIARGRMEVDDEGKAVHFPGVVVDITARQRAEEALKKQSIFVETITNSLGAGVYALDEHAHVTYVNDAALKMLGYTARELMGKNLHDIIHYELPDGTPLSVEDCTLLTVIKTGKAISGEDEFITKRRIRLPISYASAPIVDDDGNITGSVLAFSDITERRETEEILRYQSLILGSITDAIVTFDTTGVVTGWNNGASHLFGYTEKQAIGKHSEQLLQMLPQYDRLKIRQQAIETGSWRGNLVYYHPKTQEPTKVMASISALKDARGKVIGIVSILQDLTEIKQAQAEAEAARLRARVSRAQATTLQKQNEQLLAISRTKDEFIALASHQLRTPATGVKQYLGMVLEGFSEPLSPGQKNFLERAYACNERQLRIVEDILRVAQVDLDKIKLHIEPSNINDLVADIVDSQSGEFIRRKQQILVHRTRQPLVAAVDRERFRMAVDNIIDNAGKYTTDGKTIDIRVSKSGTRHFTVTISDEGVGISKHDQAKLFQKFSRLDNPLSIEVGGNGLGLYWSKKIINLHGGDISVVSHPGKGSHFTIKMPLQQLGN
jgi:PAS domain S-box-containing protein